MTDPAEQNSLQIQLTEDQQFDIESFRRQIDEVTQIEDLRVLCKNFLELWYLQRASAGWMVYQKPLPPIQLKPTKQKDNS